MALFMEYEGIKGDVTEPKHKQWIELHSMSFGAGRAISTPSGATAGRECGICSVSEITVAKPMDTASQQLLRESMIGAVPGKKVILEQLTTGQGNQAEVTLKLELENCMISGYSVSSGGDRPSESLSLNFTKITYTLSQGKTEGDLGQPAHNYYDISLAQGG
jgi:type VI secretion system secreted protein Hcp